MSKPRFWVLVLALIAIPLSVSAHPLGNFTINQYLGLHLTPESLTVDYVLDMAEIPTSQTRREIDTNQDDQVDEEERDTFRRETCSDLAKAISVKVNSRSLDLGDFDSSLQFPDGEAGLPTLRLECRFLNNVRLEDGSVLEVVNSNDFERLGWSELVVTAEGLSLQTDIPNESITDRLRDYPEDLLSSPIDRQTGSIVVSIEDGASIGDPPPPVGVEQLTTRTPVDQLAALIDPDDGGPAVPIALAIALGLGVLHALAPGHGKTVMAAYLVGSRGTLGHAAVLGLAVAVSHTIGVLALGLLTLLSTAAFAPEEVFPILSTVSGLIITGIGVWMFVRWLRGRGLPNGGRAHEHGHGSAAGEHSHGLVTHTHSLPAGLEDQPGWKVLGTMGLAGGLVPSASAVVLLLAAVNFGRIPLGILLIALFGVGMAVTLVGVGFLLVTATRFTTDHLGGSKWVKRLRAVLTPVAAVVVITVGVLLTARLI